MVFTKAREAPLGLFLAMVFFLLGGCRPTFHDQEVRDAFSEFYGSKTVAGAGEHDAPLRFIMAVKGFRHSRSGVVVGELDGNSWWAEYPIADLDELDGSEGSLLEYVANPPDFGDVRATGLCNPDYESRIKANGTIGFFSRDKKALPIFMAPFANWLQGVPWSEMARSDKVEFLEFAESRDPRFPDCMVLTLKPHGAEDPSPQEEAIEYHVYFDNQSGLCRGSFSPGGETTDSRTVFLKILEDEPGTLTIVGETKTDFKEDTTEQETLSSRFVARCVRQKAIDLEKCRLEFYGLTEPQYGERKPWWNSWWTLLSGSVVLSFALFAVLVGKKRRQR